MRVPDVRPREAGRARRRREHGAAGGLGLYDHFGRQVACRLKAKDDGVGTFRLLVWRMPVCAECPPQGAGAAAAPRTGPERVDGERATLVGETQWAASSVR